MRKLAPENKLTYTLEGVQLFSKSDIGKLLGIHRNTADKNLKEWEVKPKAKDKRGNDLFAVIDYIHGQNRSRLSQDGDERFGGYEDAMTWKTAIDAKRGQLKLDQETGELVNAFEAEMEIASCFADCAKMGELLLTIVDNTLHPIGEEMEDISTKFKRENQKYYEQIIKDTEHSQA